MNRPDLIQIERGHAPRKYKKQFSKKISIVTLGLVLTIIFILFISR